MAIIDYWDFNFNRPSQVDDQGCFSEKILLMNAFFLLVKYIGSEIRAAYNSIIIAKLVFI